VAKSMLHLFHEQRKFAVVSRQDGAYDVTGVSGKPADKGVYGGVVEGHCQFTSIASETLFRSKSVGTQTLWLL